MYAVIDTETTGLFNRDRVIEIAIVRVSATGHVEDSWHTLVNPLRDLGRQDLHGIRAADAAGAPRFADIAGDVAARLRGLVPVAHNLSFDSRMLDAEFARLGCDLPRLGEYGVCTMSWATEFLPGARSLADCCAAAGIHNDRPHEALSDALATAELLAHYVHESDGEPPWTGLEATATGAEWPALPVRNTPVVHRRNESSRPDFTAELPERGDQDVAGTDARRYLSLVDRALIDRYVSLTEAHALTALAKRCGLGRTDLRELHHAYLRVLACSGADESDLRQVRRELHLPDSADAAHREVRWPQVDLTPFRLRHGDVVVLTGDFTESKSYWTDRLADNGFQVAGHVSRRTSLVVAADPDSMSGKARKARQYGIPVTGARAFPRILSG